jgi:hypothetical protein
MRFGGAASRNRKDEGDTVAAAANAKAAERLLA